MIDAGDLVLTVLTGRRPDLLRETLDSLALSSPGLLESATVFVLHNGGDKATQETLSSYRPFLDDVETTDNLLPIPLAGAKCGSFAESSDRTFWMHLEDDWRSLGVHRGWLQASREILDGNQEVAQVRLRHHLEPVLKRHMVTSQPLDWKDNGHWLLSRNGHVTNNPSLRRSQHGSVGYPCRDEKDMQVNWMKVGLTSVAQLKPGEFVHIGQGPKSLKRTDGSGTVEL